MTGIREGRTGLRFGRAKITARFSFLLGGALLILPFLCQARAVVTGDLKVWNKVTITFDGPSTSENAGPNPFRNFRLNVAFVHPESGSSYVVPGYYTADGNAAETSASRGNRWRVHFTPSEEGRWNFVASFRAGADVAVSLDPEAGTATSFDRTGGSFQVGPAEKSANDSRWKGMLRYVGDYYLMREATGEYFLKGGADSPENFLAYYEFDGTFDTDAKVNEGSSASVPFIHHYAPHRKDWREGDPTWQKGKGKNIIGALNYLAGKGMNSVYFLTYNIDGGDGKDVWMWTSPEVRDRYDVSKLAQWEIVFSHMDQLGIQLHVVTQETENDRKLGGGPGLNPVRKLYYRELVARFGHHLAVMWNLGEENNTSDPDRKEIANYIRTLDIYKHPITVHTHNNKAPDFYNGLLGDPNFEATSIQANMESYNRDAIVLRERSAKAGRKWVIFGDEQPPARAGVLPDDVDPDHYIPRAQALWGILTGGGAGVEWYFGYDYPNNDLNCEDWRSRDRMWDQTRYALTFFHAHLPFWEMAPNNALATDGADVKVFAKEREIYAVSLPKGGSAKLDVQAGTYSVRWYNPRTGGELQSGSVTNITGPGLQPIGNPPNEAEKDWVVLIKRNR